MRKFRYLGLALLLVCVLIVSGCTKANSAKIETCNNLYALETANYGVDEQTNKIKVFDEDGFVNLCTYNSYSSTKLYNLIASTEEECSPYVFNILKRGGEYDTIIQAVSKFYLNNNKSSFSKLDKEVPQNLKTHLYEAIDDLGDILKNLVVTKKALETTVNNFSDFNIVPVNQALKTFLTNYQELIESFYEISSTYEQIRNTYLSPVITKTQIPLGGIENLINSGNVYIAKYYYLKHLVLNGFDDRFASQKILNEDTNQYIENETYDAEFANFVQIVNSTISETTNDNVDKIFYYGAALTKFDSLKTNLKNYEVAVKYIANYNGKITSKSVAYQYVEFMKNFDQEVTNYQNYIIAHLL